MTQRVQRAPCSRRRPCTESGRSYRRSRNIVIFTPKIAAPMTPSTRHQGHWFTPEKYWWFGLSWHCFIEDDKPLSAVTHS